MSRAAPAMAPRSPPTSDFASPSCLTIRSVMLMASSPMRSRSVMRRIAIARKRRSSATGLPQRQDPQDERVDLELVAIDALVELLHQEHARWISPHVRVAGQPDDAFASSPHREQVRPQLAKLGLEVAAVRGARGR